MKVYTPKKGKLVEDNSSFGSGLANMIQSLVNRITGAGITTAQSQQNLFNAEQAAVNRQFQAEQVDLAYEREKQAHQNVVKDMQAAGLNPALMYQGGVGGTSVPPPASGSTASAASDVGNGVSFSDMLRLATLPQELRNLEAQNELRQAQAENQRSLTALNNLNIEWFEPMTDAKLKEVYSLIENRSVQNELAKQGISESQARQALTLQQAVLAAIDAETRNTLNNKQIELANADIALKQAEKVKNYSEVDRIKHEISVLDAQCAELMERAILESCQAGMVDQQTQNELERNGILKLDKQSKQFDVDHQEAYWKWKKAMYVVDGINQTARSVSSFYMPQISSPSLNPASTIYNSPSYGHYSSW